MTNTIELSWEQVRVWRVERQYLAQPAPDLLTVTSRLVGLHAQLMSSAELSLWARLADFEPGTLSKVLWEDRLLVKTWAVRGTLHLLPAREYGLWQAALSTYRHYLRPVWFRSFGLTPDELTALIAVVGQALNGQVLTRQALAERVAQITGVPHLGEKVMDSWGAMLKPASFQGQLCFGPGEGQKVSFTRPASWLPDTGPAFPPDAALTEIARRFLDAYGPATGEDFGRWWSSLSPNQAVKLFQKLSEAASPVTVEGTPAYALTEHLAALQNTPVRPTLNLLPAFDPYLIGSTAHVESLLPGPYRARIHRPQGWVSPVVLVNGRIDGLWRHERKGNRLIVQVEPLAAFDTWAEAALESEARRLATFLGGQLELTVKPGLLERVY